MKLYMLPAGFLACLLLAGCAPGADAGETIGEMTIPALEPVSLGSGEKLQVVATTNIIGDVVSRIGGDDIVLTTLIPQGQDPHSYTPVAQNLAAIERADVVFVNGLGLEETLLDAVEANASGPVVPVSAGIDPLPFEGDDDHEDEETGQAEDIHLFDPHFWLAPDNVQVWAANIAQVLSTLDPAHAGDFAARAVNYDTELAALDADIRAALAEIPPDRRKLITDHAAFGYFAATYGFEQIGTIIPGASTAADTSAGDMAALAALIQSENVPAIFVGASSGSRLEDLATTIAEEAGTEVRVLALYTGSLDAPGTPAGTYLDMMRFNVAQIVAGLAR
jgi:ABC-type Zn uptake system ZnuABC Zn-binding protein ZnuA